MRWMFVAGAVTILGFILLAYLMFYDGRDK